MTESSNSGQKPADARSTAELRRNAHVLVLQEMRTRFTDVGCPSRTDALDAAISALSAQPSPGGQGDRPLRVFSAGVWTYDGTGQSFSHEDMDAAAFVVYRDAALAARQPVYEGHTWVSDYVLAGLRERAEMPLQLRNGEVWHWQGDGHDFPESLVCPVIMSAETLRELIAARQPVGQIPAGFTLVPEKFGIPAAVWEGVEFVIGGPGTGEGESYLDSTAWIGDLMQDDGSSIYGLHLSCDECPEDGSVTLAEFAAPPAQAVDLEQFRPAVCAMGLYAEEPEDVDEAKRLLALIDNQAVGNG